MPNIYISFILNLLYVLLYSLISLILKFYFSKIYSITVIPWIGAVSYILIVVPYIFFKAKNIVTKGEKNNDNSY